MLDKLRAYLNLNNIQFSTIEGNQYVLLFSIDGLNFLAEFNREADPSFFRIMLPSIETYLPENTNQHDTVNRLNGRYKCGKVMLIGDNQLWLSAESFICGNVDAPTLFAKLISVLRDMINEYRRLRHD